MRALVFIIIALIAAVIAGHYVAEDPGFIVIGYGGKVVRTTFAFFVFALAVLFAVVYMVLAMGGATRRLARRRREKSENRRVARTIGGLADGMTALAAGDYAAAEKAFIKGADEAHRPEAAYLAAAFAAEGHGAHGKRDHYLTLARDAAPAVTRAARIRQAGWLLDAGDIDKARPLIEKLAEAPASDPVVLGLQYRLYRDTGDQQAVFDLIGDLRRDRVLSHDTVSTIERETTAHLFADPSADAAAVKDLWHRIPRNLRVEPDIVAAYARALARNGQHDEAEALLRKRIERQWNSMLVGQYGEIHCEPPTRQLRKLEAWAMTRGDDPGLRLARARQAIRGGLWALAREQIEALMAQAPSPLLHQLLADIAEGMGDTAVAIEQRRAGLELATGETGGTLLPAPGADGEAA